MGRKGVKPPWLIGVERRTLRDIKYRLTPYQIYDLITAKTWPYKTNPNFYHCRDRALMAILFISGGRIHETLRLIKGQFDFKADPDFIIIRNFYVGKRKKKTLQRYGQLLREVPLPKNPDAILYRFTKLIVDYLNLLKSNDDLLFKFGRIRAWQIVNHCTGRWNHWFRAMSLSWFANLIRNPYAVAQMLGIENVNTIMWYFTGTWQDYRDQLLR